MKGRVTYDQLNGAVRHMNTAVKAKYRILHQPLKGLNNHSRKLQARFKEQETKATKGTCASTPLGRGAGWDVLPDPLVSSFQGTILWWKKTFETWRRSRWTSASRAF